ncbi:MAG: hypothetical protein ACJAZ8_000589 [Planctomycetota bacterium]|jgi:hypothetical protein
MGGAVLGAATVLLVLREPQADQDLGKLNLQERTDGAAVVPSLPEDGSLSSASAVAVESQRPAEALLAEGLVISESGEEIFTRERAIKETGKVLLEKHVPKPTTFVRSYTSWPDDLTPETSKSHFGRDLTQAEVAGIQAIHDGFLPDMLALAGLMRGEYGDIIRTVEKTRSYNLDRIYSTEPNPRTPQNHNVITMPGWRATYPVGYDTYPHLLVTSKAATALRKQRDHAVAAYLSANR